MTKYTEEKKYRCFNKRIVERYFLFFILIPIIFWSFAFSLIKIGLEELSPINLTIMRLFIVCTIFFIILIFKHDTFSKLQKKDIPILFSLGFFGIVIYHLALNYGEQFISAGAASLIIATIPLFVVILAILFLSEKITYNIVIGISLSLIGVIIISIYGNENIILEINYISGAIAVLIAAIAGAGYTVAGKKLLQKYTPISLTIYAFLIGCLGLIPFINYSLIEEVTKLSSSGWFAVIILAVFPTIIGYVFWYVILEIKPASKISVYLYLTPVFSTIIAFFFLNEEVTYLFILGGFLVILGLYIVNINKNKT